MKKHLLVPLIFLQAAGLAAQTGAPAQQPQAPSETCAAATAFKPTADAVAALQPDLATQPLMTAMYDFRQAVREALGSALKDRDQLDFKANAAIFAKDYAVLNQFCAKTPAAKTAAILAAMSAVQTALNEAAPPPAQTRDKLAARLALLEEELKDTDWEASTPRQKEAQARKGLAALKTALETYKLDNGTYPATLSALTTAYLSSIPEVAAGGKPAAKTANVDNDTYINPCEAVTGKGGWLYFSDDRSPVWGTVVVNSRLKAPSGKAWCALRPEKDPGETKKAAPAKFTGPAKQVQAAAPGAQGKPPTAGGANKAEELRKAGYEEFSEAEHSWLLRATQCSDETLIKFNKMQIITEKTGTTYFIPTAKVNPMDSNDYLLDYLRKYRAGDQTILPEVSPGAFGTGGTVRRKLCNKNGTLWTGE